MKASYVLLVISHAYLAAVAPGRSARQIRTDKGHLTTAYTYRKYKIVMQAN
jgi:hypothetical protein